MEDEINFCPYCDASQHKIMLFRDTTYFCKDCNRFYNLQVVKFNCPKCDKTDIVKTDFPSPNGDPIFQCKHCKKMFPASEILKYENTYT